MSATRRELFAAIDHKDAPAVRSILSHNNTALHTASSHFYTGYHYTAASSGVPPSPGGGSGTHAAPSTPTSVTSASPSTPSSNHSINPFAATFMAHSMAGAPGGMVGGAGVGRDSAGMASLMPVEDVRESCSRFGAMPFMFAKFGYRAASWLQTPLQYASSRDATGVIVDALIRGGCNVNNVGSLFASPLHIACKYDQEGAVRVLLNAGADMSAMDAAGRTPRDVSRSDKVRKLLDEAMAKNEQKPDWVMVDWKAQPLSPSLPLPPPSSPLPTPLSPATAPTTPLVTSPQAFQTPVTSPSRPLLSPMTSPTAPLPMAHPDKCTCLRCQSDRDREAEEGETPAQSVGKTLQECVSPNTWKAFSGRQSGPDGYKRGDLSRGLFRMYRTKSCTFVPPEDAGGDITTFGLVPFEELELKEKIGSGSYGTVYDARWKGTRLAAKMLKRTSSAVTSDGPDAHPPKRSGLSAEPDSADAKEKGDLLNEIRVFSLLSEVQHQNIIAFIGACSVGDHICLCTEFATDGSLYDFMHHRDEGYDLRTVRRWGLEIADGMHYLESKGILHRDLKSPNILLTKDTSSFLTLSERDRVGEPADVSNLICKLCDFGLACESSRLEGDRACGTFRWMAPEVMKNETVTSKSDVYSYGIVLWEIATREKPFGDISVFEVVYSVCEYGTRPTVPEGFPPSLMQLVTMCWDADPEARPSFSDVLKTLHESPLPIPSSVHSAIDETHSRLSRDYSSETLAACPSSESGSITPTSQHRTDPLEKSVRALELTQSDWSREIKKSWECIPCPMGPRMAGLCKDCIAEEVKKSFQSASTTLLSIYLNAARPKKPAGDEGSAEETPAPTACRVCGADMTKEDA